MFAIVIILFVPILKAELERLEGERVCAYREKVKHSKTNKTEIVNS